MVVDDRAEVVAYDDEMDPRVRTGAPAVLSEGRAGRLFDREGERHRLAGLRSVSGHVRCDCEQGEDANISIATTSGSISVAPD